MSVCRFSKELKRGLYRCGALGGESAVLHALQFRQKRADSCEEMDKLPDLLTRLEDNKASKGFEFHPFKVSDRINEIFLFLYSLE